MVTARFFTTLDLTKDFTRRFFRHQSAWKIALRCTRLPLLQPANNKKKPLDRPYLNRCLRSGPWSEQWQLVFERFKQALSPLLFRSSNGAVSSQQVDCPLLYISWKLSESSPSFPKLITYISAVKTLQLLCFQLSLHYAPNSPQVSVISMPSSSPHPIIVSKWVRTHRLPHVTLVCDLVTYPTRQRLKGVPGTYTAVITARQTKYTGVESLVKWVSPVRMVRHIVG